MCGAEAGDEVGGVVAGVVGEDRGNLCEEEESLEISV